MKCHNCNNEVRSSSKFCPKCGHGMEIEKIGSNIIETFRKKTFLIAFIMLDIFLVLIIGLVFVREARIDREMSRAIADAQEEKPLKIRWISQKEIYPLLYAGDDKMMGEIRIDSERNKTVYVESYVEDITKTKEDKIEVKPGVKMYKLAPAITQDGYDLLDDKQEKKFYIKVYEKKGEEEKILLEDATEIFFYSLSDMIWEYKGRNNSKYVVRLIDKDKEKVQGLVGKAAKRVSEFNGEYNAMVGPTGDEKQSISEMKAIFKAMTDDYDINYVLAPFDYRNPSNQQLKTPTKVIETQSGLCIELSLLMAAALENVGHRPVIVVTSNHAWAGIETVPNSREYSFIETTMLESTPDEAMEMANENWINIQQTGDFRVLNVNDLRIDGILPIDEIE